MPREKLSLGSYKEGGLEPYSKVMVPCLKISPNLMIEVPTVLEVAVPERQTPWIETAETEKTPLARHESPLRRSTRSKISVKAVQIRCSDN